MFPTLVIYKNYRSVRHDGRLARQREHMVHMRIVISHIQTLPNMSLLLQNVIIYIDYITPLSVCQWNFHIFSKKPFREDTKRPCRKSARSFASYATRSRLGLRNNPLRNREAN